TAKTYTLSLHDALPISEKDGARSGQIRSCAGTRGCRHVDAENDVRIRRQAGRRGTVILHETRWRQSYRRKIVRRTHHHRERPGRSEEHTSELQSRFDLV